MKYPDHVYLLRGGKDNASMSRIYGLYDECKRVYGGVQSWKLLVSTFQCLPLAAVIDDRVPTAFTLLGCEDNRLLVTVETTSRRSACITEYRLRCTRSKTWTRWPGSFGTG